MSPIQTHFKLEQPSDEDLLDHGFARRGQETTTMDVSKGMDTTRSGDPDSSAVPPNGAQTNSTHVGNTDTASETDEEEAIETAWRRANFHPDIRVSYKDWLAEFPNEKPAFLESPYSP
jgi:hypothetical protein